MFRVFDKNDQDVGLVDSRQAVLALLDAPSYAYFLPLENCEGRFTIYVEDQFIGSCVLDSIYKQEN